MTAFGSLETERKLEQLQSKSATQTGREKIGSSLALAYGIRALEERSSGAVEDAILSYQRAIHAAYTEARWHEKKADLISSLAIDLEYHQNLIENGLHEQAALFIGTTNVLGYKLEKISNRESPSSLFKQAKLGYSRALYYEPQFTPALIGRANVFAKMGDELESKGDYKEAIKILDRALTVDPNDLTSREERAEAFEGLGQIEEAVEDLKHIFAAEEDTTIQRRIQELEEKLQANRKDTGQC